MQHSQSFTFIHILPKIMSNSVNSFILIHFYYNTLRLFLSHVLSQSRRLPLLQVVSNNKSFSVGVQSPTEINAPRGCAVILRRICQLSLTRITHQVSRAFDLNCNGFYAWIKSSGHKKGKSIIFLNGRLLAVETK